MITVGDILNAFLSVCKTIGIADVLDMLLLSYLLFKCFKLVKETRAQQLVKGIGILVVAYLIADIIGLKTMSFILKNIFQWGILAIIIMFQPELRRILEKLGRTKFVDLSSVFNSSDSEYGDESWAKAIDVIGNSVYELAATATGALIVCERQTRLGEQIDTGTILNCTPSEAVLGNIFFPNTPLHDGAVIMRDGMILAAGCFLPKPQKEELINKQLGSRHRAAIGMSENSDAIVIVVSEETGTVSVAEDGELTRGYTKDSLKKLLRNRLMPEKPSSQKKDKKPFAEKVRSKWKKDA